MPGSAVIYLYDGHWRFSPIPAKRSLFAGVCYRQAQLERIRGRGEAGRERKFNIRDMANGFGYVSPNRRGNRRFRREASKPVPTQPPECGPSPPGLRAKVEAGGVPTSCDAPGNPAADNFPTPASANPPTNCIAEEVRRNLSDYNYIKMNRLDTWAGLAAAFTRAAPIAFPNDAVEIKIDWIPVPTLIQFLRKNNSPHLNAPMVGGSLVVGQRGQ